MGLPKSAMQGILGGLLQGVDEHAQATIEQNRKQAEEQYAVHKQHLEGIIKSMREHPNNPYNPRHLVAAMGDLYSLAQGPQKKSRSLNFEDPKLNFLTRLLGGEIDLSPEPGGMHQAQNEARLQKLPEDAYYAAKEDGEERSDAPGTAEPVDQHSPLPVRMAEGPPPQAPETPHTATAAEGALADEMASAAQAVAQTPPAERRFRFPAPPPPQYAGDPTLGMPLGQPTGQIPTYAEVGVPGSLAPTPNPALSQSARSRMAAMGIGPPVARPQGPGLNAQLIGEYGTPRDRTGQWEGWTPGVAGQVPPMMGEGFERVEDDEPTSVGYGTGIITPDHRGRVQEEPSELFSGARTESDPYGLGHGWNEDDYLRTQEQTDAWKAHLASERLRSTLNTYEQARADYPNVPESVLQSLVGVQQGGQGPQISGGERWRFPDGNEHVLYTHRDGYRVDNNFQRTEIPDGAQLVSTFAIDEASVRSNPWSGAAVARHPDTGEFGFFSRDGRWQGMGGFEPVGEINLGEGATEEESPARAIVGSLVDRVDNLANASETSALSGVRDTVIEGLRIDPDQLEGTSPEILLDQADIASAMIQLWPEYQRMYRDGTLNPWLERQDVERRRNNSLLLSGPPPPITWSTSTASLATNGGDWMLNETSRGWVQELAGLHQQLATFRAEPQEVVTPRGILDGDPDPESPTTAEGPVPLDSETLPTEAQFRAAWTNPAVKDYVQRLFGQDGPPIEVENAYAMFMNAPSLWRGMVIALQEGR